MTTVTQQDAWVSIAAAAEKLGIHPRTLRRYIRQGRVEVMRLSPQVVRITPEELVRFQDESLKIDTGTGTCYVPKPPSQADEPAASTARIGQPLPATRPQARFGPV